MIIAIDGPAGAGKSTVAKILAEKLGFLYIDTGAMYRALTLKLLDGQSDLKETQKVISIAQKTTIELNNQEGVLKVFLDGRDVSREIREPRVSACVSDVAKIKEVREIMCALQRRLGKQHDSVMDGRDIGTVVFPDADRKFYVDAQFEERVNRRYKELKGNNQGVEWKAVEADLRNRDTIDSTRECAPLRQASDALYIDTTGLSIEQVVEVLAKHIPGRV